MKNQLFIALLLLLGALVSFAQEEDEETLDLKNTILYGDYLEMKSGDEISEFNLTGNVNVIATNLELTSDELYIVALKKGDADATVTEMGKITKFTATGNVKIITEGRTAEAGHAEFMPEEKTVVLTINPVVTDDGRTVSGERITWSHGDRRAQVEGGDQHRVKVTLGALPDSGFDPNAPDEEGDESEGEPAVDETSVEEVEPEEESATNPQ
jgi:lipopolysaccharide transport protein LptA